MRRSARIRWQIPVQVTSVDPAVPFNETCETVAVNAHGCGLISHSPLEKGTAVKLGMLPDGREAMARIADVVKLGDDGRTWLLGLQLDVPGNPWGVRNPPHDWAIVSNNGQAGVPLAASAAAGASGAGAVSTATLAAPEFSIVSPPSAPPSIPNAVQSAGVEPPRIEPARSASNNGGSGRSASEPARAGGPAYTIRDRDWAELRRQMEDHLQDLMWQVDDQVEAKLEHWKEQMVDAEARLDSLCKLQDRLQAHVTVLSEIVKDKVQPEEGAGQAEDSLKVQPAPAENAGPTPSQVEEIRQLQQWMQSLINLLPQAVEQHANEAVGSAEQRLRAQAEEQLEGLRKQVAELQARLEAAATASAVHAEDKAAEDEKRTAAEATLRAAGEEIGQSLQKSLREEFEKLQQELRQAQQEVEAKAERLQKLEQEAAGREKQRSAEAGQRDQELKQTAEAAMRDLSEEVRSELRASLQAELEEQNQRLQKATAAVEEKAAGLQARMSELTAQSEEAQRARESLESVVASLTQAASQQIKEDIAAGLQKISSEAQEQGERRQKEFADQLSEVQRNGAGAQEHLTKLLQQADEVALRLEASDRAREAMQSRLDSAIAAAQLKVEGRADDLLERVGKRSEEHIKRLQEQVSAQQRKLDELTQQRQQEIQMALDAHVETLRGSSEVMLRRVADDLRGTLNNHLKEEFATQRHIWEKQREASQAEKAWVESRANELAARWEGRLQGYIEQATGAAVDKLRADVERAAGDIIRTQMAEVQKQLSGSLEPLLSRADLSTANLEKLLAGLQQEAQRAETQSAAFQRQRDEAQDWMEKQMEKLRQAVHDAVVETSGEIKGRIHMAVEMAREPIEQRSREAQRQVEELAARKSREIAERLSELEKAMEPRLQAHLAEAMAKFQKDSEELAQKSVHRSQDELEETLNSMLHLMRGKREGRAK
jgi:hypothetical protein